MNSIEDLINRITEGTGITEEQKKALIGMYAISLYKTTLELLLGIKGSDPEIQRQITDLFDSISSSFSAEESENFNKVMEHEKIDIIQEVVLGFVDGLESEMKEKIWTNVEKL